MSSRENNGIQIALIIFVIITVVLCVFTYFFYSQAESRGKQLAAAQTKNQNLTQANADLQSKVMYLRYFIGDPDLNLTRSQLEDSNMGAMDPELEKLLKKYDRDMKMYGEGLPEDKLNYSSIAENLIAAIRLKNTGIADANDRLKAAVQTRDKTVADETKKTQAALAGQKKAADDLAQVNATFTSERERMKTELATTAKTVAELQKSSVEVREAARTREEELTKQVEQSSVLNEALKDQLAGLSEESFELPDGKVTWVNQSANMLWINLGSADGLRTQTTFAVYEHNANGVANQESKGRIEVTKIMAAHQAQCRILEDELANPILPGDLIHTPAWQPGRKLHFALAGVLDVDGDDRSDPNTVRRVVTMNGGVVDLELKMDGSVDGQMSVNTRYLVLGEPPTGSDGQVDENVLTTYSEIIRDARKLGVDEISLDEFLNFMGWKAGSRTVPLGKRLGGAPPSSYIEESTDQTAPARGADGAF